jgi:Bacteriocin-protection, YdeI or OmpD-Associated/Domain of unknown function (DUF1905)
MRPSDPIQRLDAEPASASARRTSIRSTRRETWYSSCRDRSMSSRTFTAMVVPAGNATGVDVPAEVVDALGAGARPLVTITINGHSWRSRVASMGGRFIVGISAANRAASGIATGDEIEIALELDTEPRIVVEPTDLAEALDAHPAAREEFDKLPYGLRRKHVTAIDDAKSAETRQRRIGRLIDKLRGA